MDKLKVAVLGATGIVGQMFVSMLADHPRFELGVLAASAESAQKKYSDAAGWVLEGHIPPGIGDEKVIDVGKLHPKKDFDIAFSALPANIAESIERKLAFAGIAVFSNAAAHRMYPEVPILIPEINPDHLKLVDEQKKKAAGFIVTNSNCTTSGIVLPLHPLRKYGIKDVVVSSYQALSGAGHPGVSSLDALGNVIPFIPQEEEKVELETRKIMGAVKGHWVVDANINVLATCVRVPVRNGHFESVVVELEEDVSENDFRKTLASCPGVPGLDTAPVHPVIVREEQNRPQPLLDVNAGIPERARGMAVSVGRVRKVEHRFRFVSLVNNLVRGAAGGSIINAEYALAKGCLDR